MKIAILLLAPLCLLTCATSRTVHSPLLPLSVTVVDRNFTYAGSQRFVLRERADTEQHLFVDASEGDVRRFVWIQYERFLPTVDARYEYANERIVDVGGTKFTASVREYTTPPDPGSDRSRAYTLVESRGFRMPAKAKRARLVHVAPDGRSEVMIVYAETAGDDAALIERAVAAVRVKIAA